MGIGVFAMWLLSVACIWWAIWERRCRRAALERAMAAENQLALVRASATNQVEVVRPSPSGEMPRMRVVRGGKAN